MVGPAAADHAAAPMGEDLGWVHKLRQKLPPALYELLELTYTLVAYRRLAQAAREFKPDLVYERYNLFLLAGAMLRKRFGLPLLLEVNAPLAQERGQFGGLGLPRLAAWAETRAWQDADAVLPVTRCWASMCRRAVCRPSASLSSPTASTKTTCRRPCTGRSQAPPGLVRRRPGAGLHRLCAWTGTAWTAWCAGWPPRRPRPGRGC